MEPSECVQKDPLSSLKLCIESDDILNVRQDVSRFFSMAAKSHPNVACNLLMRAIEKLLKAKAPPIAEISLLFAFLTSDENHIAIERVLTTNLPQKYSKLQYYLRVYTLRALGSDRSFSLPNDTLQILAGDSDIGRLTVIDFLLTRTDTQESHAQLLQRMRCSLENVEKLGKTRKIAIDVLCTKFNVSLKSPSPELEWRSLDSLKSILSNWNNLVSSNPEDIRNWIANLLAKSDEFSDSRVRAISKSLTNLGTELKNDPISVELWSAAIKLEEKLDSPTSEILKKTWRLCLSATLHPTADFLCILLGLKLCLTQMNVQPSSCRLSPTDMESFSGVASALVQARSWKYLAQQLSIDCGKSSPYSKVITWLLLHIAGMAPEPDRDFIDEIMPLTQRFDTLSRVELEEAYCCAFGTCFDEKWLFEVCNMTSSEQHIRDSALALLARSCLRSDPHAAYQYCKKITQVGAIAHEIVLEGGFVDIAYSLKIDTQPIYPDIPVQNIQTTIRNTKALSDPAKMLDNLVGAWFALYYNGCHQDAMRFVQLAVKSSRVSFGADSVRYRAAVILGKEFLNQIGEDRSILDDNKDSEILTDLEDHRFPYSVASLLAQPWLERCHSQNHLSLQSNASLIGKAIRGDILWSTVYDSVMANPPLVLARTPKRKPQEIGALIRASREEASGFHDMIWSERKKSTQTLRLMHLIEDQLSLKVVDTKYAPILFSDEHQHQMLQASRLFHAPQAIPAAKRENTLEFPCIHLEIEESGALIVTRIEENRIVASLRLPYGRRVKLQKVGDTCDVSSADFSDEPLNGTKRKLPPAFLFNTKIERLVSESMKTPTQNAKEFWAAQETMDAELQNLIEEQEKMWFGGFLGIITAVSGGLNCDPLQVTQVKGVFATYLEYQRQNIQWDISSVHVALLRTALERGVSDEIEDVVMAIVEAMNFQELAVNLQELNFKTLIERLEHVLIDPDRPKSLLAENERRLVLICDKSAAQVPWEMFPALRENKFSVTRALSLQQVAEWCENAASSNRDASEHCASYLVNPGRDLLVTQKTFVADFRRRGWNEIDNEKPSEDEIGRAMVDCDSFIYIGHGSGKGYIRGSELRRRFCSKTAVYLFGCNSLKIANPMLDDDALTDYSVMGSSLIMGTLWTVKDKDINRFSLEFLSRVFENKQSVGSALRDSREACVLSYLTGGAPVVYGLP